MNCNEQPSVAQLIKLSESYIPGSGNNAVLHANNHPGKGGPAIPKPISDPVSGTLVALDRRLETIRKEQLAKNRSTLMQLDSQQLQTLEWVTTNITRKIFREVADELEHSALEGNGKRLSETVCLMLGLA